MAKRIEKIHSTTIGNIRIGNTVSVLSQAGLVKSIDFVNGINDGDALCKESYIVYFENSTKTLEVFDVNYVIRGEE